MKRIALFLFLLLATSCTLRAQNVSSAPSAMPVIIGHSTVALTGPWKFSTGDNPQWADPSYDDSAWESVDLTPKAGSVDPNQGIRGFVPGWTAKGHPGYSGYAWYRLHIRLSGADGALSMLGSSNVDDSYQAYVNGHLIGSFGDFTGSIPTVYTTRPLEFPISADFLKPGPDGSVTIALRFYMAPRTLLQIDPGGMHDPPLIGLPGAISAYHRVGIVTLLRRSSYFLASGLLYLLFTLFILMLYAFDRTETILLWPLGGSAAITLFLVLEFSQQTALAIPELSFAFVAAMLGPLFRGLWLITWWAYFGLQDKKWIRNAAILLTLVQFITSVVYEVATLHATNVPAWVFSVSSLINLAISAAVIFLLIFILWFGIRRSAHRDWMLIFAVILYGLPELDLVFVRLHIPINWYPFGILVPLGLITTTASLFCFSFVLMRRFRASQRRQQAIEEDVKQAQQVQQMLIPEELPQIPGFTIESEYRPAQEVGGDFFQIIPHLSDGSVLIVAGDVTGKGLQAGMLVALIVGTIRTAVEKSLDPLEIIRALNRRLCGRGNAHATCLAMHITADGNVTLANAGHMFPYLNGKELPVEGAIPLGMVPNAEFSVMRFRLKPEDRLMLLSDGIAEAQNASGQLFGFERVREMLEKSAIPSEIAAAAQKFGQIDDISVLCITRTSVPEAALA